MGFRCSINRNEVFGTDTVLFGLGIVGLYASEWRGNPALASLGVDQAPGPLQAGGNMEGKEARFGVVGSSLFAEGSTASSDGAVDAMHDSFLPLGKKIEAREVKMAVLALLCAPA